MAGEAADRVRRRLRRETLPTEPRLLESSTLSIFFVAAEFGAIPSLVGSGELVTANGRIQASFAAASVPLGHAARYLVPSNSAAAK